LSHEYLFHPEAALDIDQIWEFIARDSLDSADRVIGEIETVLEKALLLPSMGHLRPDLSSRPLRFLHVREYLISYAVEESRLWVIAVLHGRRDPALMAAILNYRQ
jgi:plasmid stabilization system protein ParE